jgi:hypothetical protein
VDVWDYFESKSREIEDFGLTRDDGFQFLAEAGSGDQRGRVWGRILLTDRTFLEISERVEVRGNHVERTEYAYYLIIDGAEVWGYELDPSHADLPVHRHDRSHARFPAEIVSFKRALEMAWETAAEEDSWSPPEDEPTT